MIILSWSHMRVFGFIILFITKWQHKLDPLLTTLYVEWEKEGWANIIFFMTREFGEGKFLILV